ncbi:MAG: DMT family transporter [Candidatus Hermodarchaeota archaeon]
MIDNQLIGVLLAISAALCWGSAGVIYKITIKEEHSLFLSILYRGMIAVPFIALLTFIINGFKTANILFHPDIFPIVIISAIFVTLGDLSFFGSLKLLDVSKAQPVASIYPLFTLIFLIIFKIESISIFVFIGTIILIVGIGLVSQEEDISSSEILELNNKNLRKGLATAFIAAFFWSLAILTVRIVLDYPEVDVFSFATLRFSILTLLMAVMWLIFDKYQLSSREKTSTHCPISSKEIVFFGLSGILSWGLGAITFFTSIELIGAAHATPISSINPLIPVIMGVFVLKEKMTSVQGLGILLVCFGSIFISFL